MSPLNLRNRLLLSLAFGVVVISALMLYGDVSQMGASLASFPWQYVPAVLGLTLFNYLLRFVKWEYFLHQIGVKGLPRGDSFLIWLSGMSMTVTPGKVGEWLKSYLLREINGTPFSTSAPVVMMERLSDGVAMGLLALGGLCLFGVGWQVVGVIFLIALGMMAAFRYRPLGERALAFGERLPIISTQIDPLRQFYESSHSLFKPKVFAVAVGLGFVSWAGECVAFYLVLEGLGAAASMLLLVQAAFILSASTLAGALLLVPGGLGVAEGGITGLTQLLLNMPKNAAAAATLVIRFCTLWFGVTLGTLAVVAVTRILRARKKAKEQVSS